MTDGGEIEPDGPAKASRGGLELSIALLLLTVYVVQVVRSAWISDDAFITLRTVDNFVQGLGLVYNVQERVQAYTHPLWMGLLGLFYFLTREAYFTVLALSLAASSAAVSVVVFRLSATRLHAVLAVTLLLASNAFVDYSTSGLENPLTHLLLGIFAALYSRGAEGGRSLALLASIAALGMVNRMDTALLFLPGLAYAAWSSRGWRSLGPLALGLWPFFAWEVFAVVYYGFPFPNTAYAKLGTGLPRSELIEQGFYYLVDSLYRDPVTLVVIVTVVAAVGGRRRKSDLALYAGAPLYLAYIVAIGGDFMSGRYFSGPYFLAVAVIAGAALSRRSIQAMAAFAVFLHFGALAQIRESSVPTVSSTGIANEKWFYFRPLGLPEFHRNSRVRVTEAPRLDEGQEGAEDFWLGGAIGFLGYSKGPGVHVVDVLGLADPLLARMPTRDGFDWRVGHLSRAVPAGYLATLRSGTNQIEDRELAEYYEKLSLVVRGELFTWARWRTIAGFHLGRYERLIDRDFYRRPYAFEVPWRRVAEVRPEGSRWNARRNVVLPPLRGVLFRLAEVSHCSRLELGLAGGSRYRLAYFRGEEPVAFYMRRGTAKATWQTVPFVSRGGIQTREVGVPEEVAGAGYDALLIYSVVTDVRMRHSVGHVVLCGGDGSPLPGTVSPPNGGAAPPG